MCHVPCAVLGGPFNCRIACKINHKLHGCLTTSMIIWWLFLLYIFRQNNHNYSWYMCINDEKTNYFLHHSKTRSMVDYANRCGYCSLFAYDRILRNVFSNRIRVMDLFYITDAHSGASLMCRLSLQYFVSVCQFVFEFVFFLFFFFAKYFGWKRIASD